MKILVCEPAAMSAKVRETLDQVGDVVCGSTANSFLERQLPDCEALFVRLAIPIDRSLLAQAPKLKFIISPTTGLDHIDLVETKRRDIRVISLRDCPNLISDVSATAEHTWGLIINLVRHITPAATDVLNGSWSRSSFWGTQLRGKTLGVLGYGRIGSMVAAIGHAFQMRVLAYDSCPTKTSPPAQSCSMRELIDQSDILTIHITADPQNFHFLSSERISRLKSGSFVINTSRAMIADSTALANAVVSGQLSGVAVDVIDDEFSTNPLDDVLVRTASEGHNILVTPHLGGATTESLAQAEYAVATIFANRIKTAK